MANLRYYPSRLLRDPWQLMTEMSQLFDDSRSDSSAEIATCAWVPAVDIKDTKEGTMLTADLPGISKKDIKVEVENNCLCISGQRNEVHEEKDDKHIKRERVQGSFYRRFTLPTDADTDNIKANVNDGVLSVLIPKRKAGDNGRVAIDVK